MTTKKINKGFTLIEVLLVMVLIGVLLSIGLVSLNTEDRLIETRNNTRQTHIQTLESAITQYKLQEGNYPTGLNRNYQEICDPEATVCTGFFDIKPFLVPTYIQAIPQDPNDSDTTGGSGYSIAIDEVTNTISLRSIQPEGGADIKINDPLPNLETSNVNTPLAVTNLLTPTPTPTPTPVPTPTPTPAPLIVQGGLVLHLDAGDPASYPEPKTGTTWTDLSGLGNNGTLNPSVGGPTYNTSNGGSLSFDGIDDRVGGTSASVPISNSFTMSVWVRHNTLPNRVQRYLTMGNEIGVIRHDGASQSGQLHFYIKTSGTLRINLRVNNSLAINTWYYIVGTWDGTTSRLYRNAVQLGTNVPGGILDGGNLTYSVSSSSESLNGNIAEVTIYNRALTAQEIQQNFNATRERFGL